MHDLLVSFVAAVVITGVLTLVGLAIVAMLCDNGKDGKGD